MTNENWSSRTAFIIAAAGSAVGLGNVWRFPYIAGENGGGTFILVYLIFVFLFGITGLFVETSAGASIKKPLIEGFKQLSKKYWLVSLLPFALNWVVFSYYIVVTGWVLFYFVQSLGASIEPFNTAMNGWTLSLFAAIALVIIIAVNALGLREGIEKINFYLFPPFVIALVALILSVAGLDGAGAAANFMLDIKMSDLTPAVLIAAFSQLMFSLSFGYGIMFTYGSYLKEKKKILGSVATVAVIDTAVSLMSTFAVFTLAYTFAIPPASGPALAFETLPNAIGALSYGRLLLPVFFFLLFCAAATSAVSLTEVLASNMPAKDRKTQTIAVLLMVLPLFIAAMLSYSPVDLKVFGMKVLDFLNDEIVTRISPISGAVLLFFILNENMKKELVKVMGMLGLPVYYVLKYAVPLFLVLLVFA